MLFQINEICSGGKSNYFGRKQFYAALKLIAASQAGISVQHPNLVNSVVNLPLPKFLWSNYEVKENNSHSNPESPDLIQLGESKNSISNERLNSSDGEPDEGTDERDNKSPKNRRVSIGASSTASDSPTPTNSVQEKSWATSGTWLGLG